MFSAFRQGPSLCGSDKEREKAQAHKRNAKGLQNLTRLLSESEAGGMCLRAWGQLPTNLFYFQTKSQGWQPSLRQGSWRQKFHSDSLLNCILLSSIPSSMQVHGEKRYTMSCGIVRVNGKLGGGFCYRQGRALSWRRSHQCRYKHLPAWPASNAVSFHRLQPSQGHGINSRHRWRLGGGKRREERRRRGDGPFTR